MEESAHVTLVDYHSREDSVTCGKELEDMHHSKEWLHERKEDCLKMNQAAPWYYIMVFAADIVFVLCSFVTLILFGDWVLFVAPVRAILFR